MLKLLLLIAVVAGAYYGFRYFKTKEKAEADAKVAPPPEAPPVRASDTRQPRAESPAEDMVACPACGTYRPAGSATCSNTGCPTRQG